MPDPKGKPLVVFSDDWGRHPSSCQHLVRRFLDTRQVMWVNTIGMRPPRLDVQTARRGLEKSLQWFNKKKPSASCDNIRVLNPFMWPWFRRSFDRTINRRLLVKTIKRLQLETAPVFVTTIPVVADLPGHVPASRWVYYCVDDFSTWPGLDQETMAAMEADLVTKVDQVIAVSRVLYDKMSKLHHNVEFLPHGVDQEYWIENAKGRHFAGQVSRKNLIVFWGVVDQRLDAAWIERLSQETPEADLMLVGPLQSPPSFDHLPNVHFPGPLDFSELPSLAAQADLLVMPYCDSPVTRAMQPLKLLEYVATGKPVVVRHLPSTEPIADCLDLASTESEFVDLVHNRLHSGVPNNQLESRQRLLSKHSWEQKAKQFEKWIDGGDKAVA